MKRSEAIETLMINSKLSLDECENVLELVELAIGMLPPTVLLSSTGEYMPTSELLDEVNIDHELSWEPEDD